MMVSPYNYDYHKTLEMEEFDDLPPEEREKTREWENKVARIDQKYARDEYIEYTRRRKSDRVTV